MGRQNLFPSALFSLAYMIVAITKGYAQRGLEVPLQLESQNNGGSINPFKPLLKEILSSQHSIYLHWTVPYFPLKTLLLFGQDKEDLQSIQLSSSDTNYTLTSLEPGVTYKVMVQVYYGSASLDSLVTYVTTQPVIPHQISGDFLIEMQIVVNSTLIRSLKRVGNLMQERLSVMLSNYGANNIHVYSIRKERTGIYILFYMSVVDQSWVQSIFHTVAQSMQRIGAEQRGLTFNVYRGCCQPFYYNAFDEVTPWTEGNILNLRVIPPTSFDRGQCMRAVDLKSGDVLVQSRGRKSLDSITISAYMMLNSVRGLQPLMSAVNFNTQLRLEVQEGQIVWMFYNLENSAGFIISTSRIMEAGKWYHVLVDYSARSGVARIFVDSVLQKKTLSRVRLNQEWLLGLRVGKYFSGGLEYKMDGYLDEFHLHECILSQKHIDRISSSCGISLCGENQPLQGPKIVVSPEMQDGVTDNSLEGDLRSRSSFSCNAAGTEGGVTTPNNADGSCTCKKYVKGRSCNICKKGTFNLDDSNPDGCTPCFCMNLTNDCRSANIKRSQITLKAKDLRNLNLRSLDGGRKVQDNLIQNPLTNAISYSGFGSHTSTEMLYWELPLRFCGDKIGSYGGNLRFTVSYLSRPYDNPLKGPDVALRGAGLELHYQEDNDPYPNQKQNYQVVLDESFWQLSAGGPVSRSQFLSALAGIDSFMLRATFSTDMIQTNLYELRLDVASYDPLTSSKTAAPMVEECKCPPQYFGTSCQYCNQGYTKSKSSGDYTKCIPCQCNNHASDCDGKTGECRNCLHFTAGPYCERCQPGYYGDPRSGRPDACRPCPCPLALSSNQFSETCVLDSDGQPTCDACKPGHGGRRCERCLSPYTGNPLKPGDFCKISSSVGKCKDCDERGSISNQCDSNGQCVCKRNVFGKKCSQCKNGYFFLNKQNANGCLKCWCSGVTYNCQSGGFYRRDILLSGFYGSIQITDVNGNLNIRQGYFDKNRNELVLSDVNKLPKSVLYWSLPLQFTGNKVAAYGGTLKYTISYEAESGKPYKSTDVKMEGGRKISLTYEGVPLIRSREVKDVIVHFREDLWTRPDGQEASRNDLMSVLADVKLLLVRATYHSGTRIASVSNIRMSDAVPYNKNEGTAEEVERCQCPAGYAGESCEYCEAGFTQRVNSLGQYLCVRCECNGHSDECDGKTGECRGCQHNTRGDHCQECRPGYFGNAVNGQCQRCACPMVITTNQFSRTCYLDGDGNQTCDACQRGYSGRDCGECASGYTGNPTVPGGKCRKTARSDEVMPSVTVSPSRRRDRIGTTATFRCKVRGSEPLTIQWSRLDGRPLPDRANVFLRPNNVKVLRISNLTSDDEESYVCTGRNSYGLTNTRVPLAVVAWRLKPIEVVASPDSLRMEEGGTARFMCSAESETTSTISWSKGTESLPSYASSMGGILTIANVQKEHSGTYTCTGSNQYSADRVSVMLQVGIVISPKASVTPPYQSVDVGASLKFRCSASGYPRPTMTWKRGANKDFSSRVEISGGTLKINEAQLEDEGDYYCTVKNTGGETTRKAVLYVRGVNSVPQVSMHPRVLRVRPRETARMLCSTSGGTPNTIKWSRLHSRGVPVRSRTSDGQLMIPYVRYEDQGTYICTASNAYGSARASGTIILIRGN